MTEMGAAASQRRCAVVTGGGGGLGEAVARRLAHDGWTVGVLDRDGDAVKNVARSIGAECVPLVADVCDESSVDAALDELAERTSIAPTALVHSAGVVRFGALIDLDLGDWRSVLEVNLTGTLVAGRAVARRMIDQGTSGAIVVVTSINGIAPGPGAGAYGASKAAAARLSQQMALEWSGHGIRVNAVAPGLIDAGMSTAVLADPSVRARRAAAVPLGRLGLADDVAAAVAFLISDDADYLTGIELVVDGGLTPSVLASLPRSRSAFSADSAEGSSR